MSMPEKKEGITIICVYCGQTMGRQREARKTDPITGMVSLEIIVEEDLDLPLLCQQSPDGKHANMIPEQARAQGFI